MFEEKILNLLAEITIDEGTVIDYSIDDKQIFTNIGGNTKVYNICKGKDYANDQTLIEVLALGCLVSLVVVILLRKRKVV